MTIHQLATAPSASTLLVGSKQHAGGHVAHVRILSEWERQAHVLVLPNRALLWDRVPAVGACSF